MKRFLMVLLFALNCFAIDGTSLYWTVKLTGDTATVSRLRYNYDSLKNWTNKASDTMNHAFQRFSPTVATHDSVVKFMRLDTIRSNPDIDSIHGNPFIDTITTSCVNADSAYIDTAYINQILGSLDIDTATIDTANIIGLHAQRGDIDTALITKATISDGTDSYYFGVASDKLTIYNDAGTPAALMMIDSSGKIGIGPAAVAPTNDLEVTNTHTGLTIFQVKNTDATAGSASVVSIIGSAGNTLNLMCNSTNEVGPYTDIARIYSGSNSGMLIEQSGNFPISFYTNSTKLMSIDSGRVKTYLFQQYTPISYTLPTSGQATLTGTFVNITNYGGVVRDTLSEIYPQTPADYGKIVYIRSAADTLVVVEGGGYSIRLNSAGVFKLNSRNDIISFLNCNGYWVEISRSEND